MYLLMKMADTKKVDRQGPLQPTVKIRGYNPEVTVGTMSPVT